MRWIAACTAGELLGFGVAALWAFVAFRVFGTDPPLLGGRIGVLGLMVVAGVCEGAVLGALQWSALRRHFPRLRAASWIGATIAVAALGWFLGMLPPTLMGPGGAAGGEEPALLVVLVFAALFGGLAGAAFGFAQWLVLRRHAARAGRWIVANAVGWALGLPWSYLAGSVADVSQSVPFAVAVGMTAGALMGLSVALATGHVLRTTPGLAA